MSGRSSTRGTRWLSRRAEKEQELQDLAAAFKGGRHGDPGGLQGAERPAGHRPAPAAPRRARAVQGREEHARQAREQGHQARVARGELRGHDGDRLHQRRRGGAGQGADGVHEGRADAAR